MIKFLENIKKEKKKKLCNSYKHILAASVFVKLDPNFFMQNFKIESYIKLY